MQHRLRTLLILLAIGPPILAGAWRSYCRWSFERQLKADIAELTADFGIVVAASDEEWAKLTRQGPWRCTPTDLRERTVVPDEE